MALGPGLVGYRHHLDGCTCCAVDLGQETTQSPFLSTIGPSGAGLTQGATGECRVRQSAIESRGAEGFPSEQVAGLHGETWLSFLHQRCASLPPEAFNALETRYQQHPIEVTDALFDAVEHWIKCHEADRA